VPSDRPASRFALDCLLLTMVLIWAVNYSLVKALVQDMPPLVFNAVRLLVSSAVFAATWALGRRGSRPAFTARDRLTVAALGVFGHCGYQLLFINGIARTTVANSALISGCTPVAVAILSAIVGHERTARVHWIGVALSLAGVYLVAGRGAGVDGASTQGDLLILASVGCWSAYTVFGRRLLERHSALDVTAATLMVGTVAFVAIALPQIVATDWTAVPAVVLAGAAASAVFALNIGYVIWYMAVQRLGSARTAVFNNLLPAVAMILAGALLGEHIDALKWLGAGAVFAGVLLTRLGPFGRRGRSSAFAEATADHRSRG
jgi:drug/metabolite transporter (DMT)-like permease